MFAKHIHSKRVQKKGANCWVPLYTAQHKFKQKSAAAYNAKDGNVNKYATLISLSKKLVGRFTDSLLDSYIFPTRIVLQIGS